MACLNINNNNKKSYPSISMIQPKSIEKILERSQNWHIQEFMPVQDPQKLKRSLPITETAQNTVLNTRKSIQDILAKKDKRILIVLGPCSIHDEVSALEYAARLKALQKKVGKTFLLVMRAYFEKPRTTVGWKGLLNDPCLNGTCDMAEGLKRARALLLKINEMGVPTATELLDPSTPSYLADLVSWAAIGARTTESQTHREMASSLPMPVGFKNSTDGSLTTAVNAIKAAKMPHTFPGISPDGNTCIVRSEGNPFAHIVLRGGDQPNYDVESIEQAIEKLNTANLPETIMVDCSHGNSRKDHRRQGKVFKNVIEQRVNGNNTLTSLMLESHLHEGSQPFSGDISQLKYGVSITDACISWEETENLLLNAHERLSKNWK